MKKTTKKEVYAVWGLTNEEMPEQVDLSDFHISCGCDDDDQAPGFFHSDKGAKLVIEPCKEGYTVTLTAPAGILAKYPKTYWLSPNPIGDDCIEAMDFGMRDVKGGR